MMEQVPIVGLAVVSGGLGGFLLGIIYFRHLRRALESFSDCGLGLRLALGAIARIFVAVAVFVLMMKLSTVAALCGLLGFSLARNLLVTKEGLV
jgi:CBS domain-containing protein